MFEVGLGAKGLAGSSLPPVIPTSKSSPSDVFDTTNLAPEKYPSWNSKSVHVLFVALVTVSATKYRVTPTMKFGTVKLMSTGVPLMSLKMLTVFSDFPGCIGNLFIKSFATKVEKVALVRRAGVPGTRLTPWIVPACTSLNAPNTIPSESTQCAVRYLDLGVMMISSRCWRRERVERDSKP